MSSLSIYEIAREYAFSTNRILFVTGKAGTGKTTFLRQLKHESPKQMAIVAPTGVAAINAGGVTIHSFFQLPFTPFFPTPEGRKRLADKQHLHQNRRNILRELELLVIDEISMVRADMLDAIDAVLRRVRYRPNEPFGGVQVIFIGDMYQLSPVAKADEWHYLSAHYKSVYFFHSHVLQQVKMVSIEFETIFRQSNPEFVSLLNEIRTNTLTAEGINLMKSRFDPTFKPSDDDQYITLTTHNSKADSINTVALQALPSPTQSYHAVVKGDFPERNFPIDSLLELKEGAKVMFLKNDTEMPRRYYNGKIGVVCEMTENVVLVQCPDDEEPIAVEPAMWENISYEQNPETKEVEEKIVGTFTQIPLRLAWAITIHKSQGLTFEQVVVDAGAAFAPGQVYVALSRCRSLEGIVLKSRIDDVNLMMDDDVIQFSRHKESASSLMQELGTAQQEYKLTALLNLYQFEPLHKMAQRLLHDVETNITSFNEEARPFLLSVGNITQTLCDVGNKYGIQLRHICLNESAHRLSERLKASSTYFANLLHQLLDLILESPTTTDNRTLGSDYEKVLLAIHNLAELKKYLIEGFESGFTMGEYFSRRKSFKATTPRIKAYSTVKAEKINTKHPQLLKALTDTRNMLAARHSVSVSGITRLQALVEMANTLPQTNKELLQIKKFGNKSAERYGQYFLDTIRTYCRENNLLTDTNLFEYPTTPMDLSVMDEAENTSTQDAENEKKTNEKKQKSREVSYALFREGKSIDEISQIRQLKVSTVAGHIATTALQNGSDLSEFLTSEQKEKAKTLFHNKTEEQTYTQLLSEHFDEAERSMVMAWWRSQQ